MPDRFDNFLIWGHGLPHRDTILDMIRARPEFEIALIHPFTPRNVARFVREVYRYDSVPFEHLRAKTRYLLTVPPEVLAIFVKNREPREVAFGEGAFRRRACMNVKQTKEAIRDRFNPRVNGRRSEDHVVHGSDHPRQVDHLLRVMGFANGIDAIAHKPSRVITAPPHLPDLHRYRIARVASESVSCTILGGDPRNPRKPTTARVPIVRSPHFRFLAGEPAAYEAYWNRFRDSKLRNDHSPEAFARLAQTFRYLEAPHEDRYIILRPDGRNGFVILDGLHRAAILQHQGQPRWIAAITA
jgi:hypothetical protein